jgi:hypothetical protein
MNSETNAKIAAAQNAECVAMPDPRYGRGMGCDTQNAYPRPSMREQAEKAVGHHREQADKFDRAAAFFRDNPAFDEFIQLVRSGAIQF